MGGLDSRVVGTCAAQVYMLRIIIIEVYGVEPDRCLHANGPRVVRRLNRQAPRWPSPGASPLAVQRVPHHGACAVAASDLDEPGPLKHGESSREDGRG